MFGHLGNAADSLNAVIYVQCKFPRSESRVHWRTRSVRVSGAILNVGPRVPGPSPQPVSRQTSHVLAPYQVAGIEVPRYRCVLGQSSW